MYWFWSQSWPRYDIRLQKMAAYVSHAMKLADNLDLVPINERETQRKEQAEARAH